MFKKSWLLVLLLLVTLVFTFGCGGQEKAQEQPQAAQEQPKEEPQAEWPEKELTVVYHSSAGSGGDIFLRALGKAVEPALGQTWVVKNVTGAAGANAWNEVLDAKDGHTVLGVSSTLITSPLLNKLPMTFRSFSPVAMMFTDPMVLFVPADSPYQSLGEIIDAARQNPGKQKWAGGTPGELAVIAGRELMKAGDFKVSIVPFEGGGDAAVTVVGGHLDAGIGEYAEIAGAVEAGQLRILVAFNEMPLRPDIPTVASEGYPEVKVEKFRGIVAPPSMPQEDVDKLAEIMKTAYDDPTFKEYYESNNLIPSYKATDNFLEVMQAQHEQVKTSLEEGN